ncbi:MAG: hypothetical protein Q9188_001185 [Gyalolechia gomerana]
MNHQILPDTENASWILDTDNGQGAQLWANPVDGDAGGTDRSLDNGGGTDQDPEVANRDTRAGVDKPVRSGDGSGSKEGTARKDKGGADGPVGDGDAADLNQDVAETGTSGAGQAGSEDVPSPNEATLGSGEGGRIVQGGKHSDGGECGARDEPVWDGPGAGEDVSKGGEDAHD